MDTEELKRIIAANIRMQRAKKDISQEYLSSQVGISPTQLGTLERGGSLPKITTLMKLAEVFGTTVDDLLH